MTAGIELVATNLLVGVVGVLVCAYATIALRVAQLWALDLDMLRFAAFADQWLNEALVEMETDTVNEVEQFLAHPGAA